MYVGNIIQINETKRIKKKNRFISETVPMNEYVLVSSKKKCVELKLHVGRNNNTVIVDKN